MSDKIKIKKNSVQETLIIPLYARVKCSEYFPEFYNDPASIKAIERIDYDYKVSGKLAKKFGALEVAMRQYDISIEIKEYLRVHPYVSVVNLGCGLDPMSVNFDNGTCRLYNIDYPDIIEIRNEIFPPMKRKENIGCALENLEWINDIEHTQGVILYGCGLFYYFKKEDVKKMFKALNKAFPEGVLVFDETGKMALKMMIKGIVKNAADIDNVDAYFSVGNPNKDIAP